jgi:asparagine synthase (glutamine-hydrolysing)
MDAGARFVVRFPPHRVEGYATPGASGVFGDEGLRVFARGYVSDARELADRAALLRLPRPSSLCELLRVAYLCYGTELSRHVSGQFCAVISDPVEQRVVLIQDSLGVVPLFYAMSGSTLCAATRLRDLLAILDETRLDPPFFATCLRDGGFFTSRSPWRGVRRLAHGECIAWSNGVARRYRPWKPRLLAHSATEQELATELRRRLDAAVSAAIEGKTWCEFSAGLDSTSVLYSALACGSSVEAVSLLSGRGVEGSDAEEIRALVPSLPCAWHAIDTDEVAPFSGEPTDDADEPHAAMIAPRRRRYAAMLKQNGVAVVLSGLGGDLAFGSVDVLPRHLPEGVFAGNLRRFWRDLQEWAADDTFGRGEVFWLRARALPQAIAMLRRRWTGVDHPPFPAWLRRGALRCSLDPERSAPPTAPSSLPVGRAALWEEAFRQAAMAARDDRQSSADFRYPLLDRNLLEFALSLPYRLRNTAGKDRVLQRRALAALLPPRTLARRVKGTAQAALDAGLRHSPAWRELLHRARFLGEMGFLDLPRWRQAVDRAAFGIVDAPSHFYAAAAMEAWLATPRSKPKPDFELRPC